MAGDHGIVAEGVMRLSPVDVGVVAEVRAGGGMVSEKVAAGTGNMTRGPAMTREQALQAMKVGAGAVEAELDRGLDVLALGEMGIGNTASAAAVAAVLMGRASAELIGRDRRGRLRPAKEGEAVTRAIEVNRPAADDPLDVLAKVVGVEIAGIAGATLAAAAQAGRWSSMAIRPRPPSWRRRRWHPLFGRSSLPPIDPRRRAIRSCSTGSACDRSLTWGCAGEGTGAVPGMFLAEAACPTLCEMATFEEAGVSTGPVS